MYILLKVSEFYERLMLVHKEELTIEGCMTETDLAVWRCQWIDPVLTVLCSGGENQQKNIIEVCVISLVCFLALIYWYL